MNALKYLGQIVAALLYTRVCAIIAYAITVLPATWLLSLSWWHFLLTVIIAGGILETIFFVLWNVIMFPFIWIVRRNIVSLILCILSFVYKAFDYIIYIWKFEHEGSWRFICLLILSSIVLLIFSLAAYSCIAVYADSKEGH